MIKLNKVSKVFWNGSHGLFNVSLDVEKGEFVFLVGPTGSGKTTLFRLLTREALPSEGVIIVGDYDVTKLPHQKISYLRIIHLFMFQYRSIIKPVGNSATTKTIRIYIWVFNISKVKI